ncbi:MAG: ubiquinone-binding protein [Legionellales bacterium]|nr:ubiquinone-binding protein [Legionellales bacterium]|tara:strand:+ start:145 stop:588 length:444 start_codon:yes stop_codon:yes gene_type:complete
MATIQQSVIVPYDQAAMYTLVDHILAYPEFVDWCVASREIERDAKHVKGALTFEFHGVQYEFSTYNRLKPYEQMDIDLIDGPFEYLTGHWYFKALNNNMCEITLHLNYAFSVIGLSLLFEPIFKRMAHHWVDAFCQRADEIYGHDSN